MFLASLLININTILANILLLLKLTLRPMAYVGFVKHDDFGVYNAHGVYCSPIDVDLLQITAFLALYPKEIVFLDLNGSWEEFDDALYDQLSERLQIL